MRLPTAITNSRGDFKLIGIPVGCGLWTEATKRGYSQYPRYYSDDKKAGHLVMMPSARVHGRLVDQNGRGISGVDVFANGLGGGGRTKTCNNGEYEFDLYPPGNYSISIPEMNGPIVKNLMKVRAEQGKTIEVPKMVALQTVLLRGRVIDSSTRQAVKGSVELQPISYQWPRPRASKIDDLGFYTHKVLPGETYRVEYRDFGPYVYNESRSRTVKVGKYGVDGVDLCLQKVETAIGYVVDQAGQPLGGACVNLPEYQFAYQAYNLMSPSYGMAETDLDGRFEIGISPDLAKRSRSTVEVQAYHEKRHLCIAESVDLQTLLDGKLKLLLKPARKLRITVLDNSGKPAAGVIVYIEPDFQGRKFVETDSRGLAVFNVCPYLMYQVVLGKIPGLRSGQRWGEVYFGDNIQAKGAVIKLNVSKQNFMGY